jgi:HK97 family phage portal protein
MSLFRKFAPEQRAVDAATFGLAIDDDVLTTSAGVRINQDTAMQIAAVWACVRLLSNSVSTLPLDAFVRSAKSREQMNPQPSWIDTPIPVDPSTTRVEHFSQVVTSLLLDGNSFTMVLPDVTRAAELHVLDPRKVTIKNDRGRPIYEVRDDRNRIIGNLDSSECIHIPWLRPPGSQRGLSPVEAFAEGLGVASAAQQFAANFFGQGSVLSGVIEYPEGVAPDQSQVDAMVKSFKKRHQGLRKSHAIGALTSGAKFNKISVTPNESQFLETQKWTVEQIARLYGIPPHMIQSQQPGAVAFASVEHRSIEYVRDAVVPLVGRIEVAYNRLLGPNRYLKFNTDGLLRGETKARWEAYREGWQVGALSINDILALEDMEPIGPDGDMHFIPLNYAPLDQIRDISLPADPPGPRPGPEGNAA